MSQAEENVASQCISTSVPTQSANVTAMPRAVTSIGDCGWHQDGAVGVCVTAVATTQRDATVRTAKRDSIETQADPRPPLTPADVRLYSALKLFLSFAESLLWEHPWPSALK